MSGKIQQRNEPHKTTLFVKAKMELWSTIMWGLLSTCFPNILGRIIDVGSWDIIAWLSLFMALIVNIFAIRLFLWRVGGTEVVTITPGGFSYERRGSFLTRSVYCGFSQLGEIRMNPLIDENIPKTVMEAKIARLRSKRQYMFSFNGDGKIQFRHNNQWHAIFSNLEGGEIDKVLTRLHELVDQHKKSDHSPK